MSSKTTQIIAIPKYPRGKKEVCGEKMAVSEGPTTDEVPKLDCSPR